MVKTKIICTLGPASSSRPVIRKMMLAGMDVARLNFSHGSAREMFERINTVRSLNKKYRRRIKLLGDLQGHRVRVGELKSPVALSKRRIILLSQEKAADSPGKIPFDYQGDLGRIKNGHEIFIDDGNIALEVIGRKGRSLKARVLIGGRLQARKGINIPQARLEFGRISREDIDDVNFCVNNGVEYVAQSFVRSPEDVRELRRHIPQGSACRVIAKIESREGINNIDSIIEASDGIMIARGDMGVSLPVYEIPVIQKVIIKKCNRAAKFVITATQMLESMTENIRPTRAEVTDVANAIIDGTDFVMLSGESAVGKYPDKTVAMMNNIIRFTEEYISKTKGGLKPPAF